MKFIDSELIVLLFQMPLLHPTNPSAESLSRTWPCHRKGCPDIGWSRKHLLILSILWHHNFAMKWWWNNWEGGKKLYLIWHNTSPLAWEVSYTLLSESVKLSRHDSQFTGRTAWFKHGSSWLQNANELLQSNMLLYIDSFTVAVWVCVCRSQQMWDHLRYLKSSQFRMIQEDAVSDSVVN